MAGKWIDWTPQLHRPDLHLETRVSVAFRDGTYSTYPYTVGDWRWTETGQEDDIIAYKIIKAVTHISIEE